MISRRNTHTRVLPTSNDASSQRDMDETDHDRARKRRAIDSTVITVLAGSHFFELTRSDLDRRPDSLLHSLLNSVETAADGVPVELDLSTTLSASLLSTFTYKTAMTVALYRHERLPVQLLSDAAKSHSTPDLLDKLQQLLDFLNIPGPIRKYLPVKDNITLRHLSVLDLYIEEAAQQAVDLMLGSSLFSSTSSTGSTGAAFFTVRLKEDVSSHYQVLVYALTGGLLPAWPKGSTAAFSTGNHIQSVQLPEGTSSSSSSTSSRAGSFKVVDLEKSPAVHGNAVSDRNYRDLYERISVGLSKAVAQVPLRGSTGGLQSCTFTASFGYPFTDTRVWAVWW